MQAGFGLRQGKSYVPGDGVYKPLHIDLYAQDFQDIMIGFTSIPARTLVRRYALGDFEGMRLQIYFDWVSSKSASLLGTPPRGKSVSWSCPLQGKDMFPS